MSDQIEPFCRRWFGPRSRALWQAALEVRSRRSPKDLAQTGPALRVSVWRAPGASACSADGTPSTFATLLPDRLAKRETEWLNLVGHCSRLPTGVASRLLKTNRAPTLTTRNTRPRQTVRFDPSVWATYIPLGIYHSAKPRSLTRDYQRFPNFYALGIGNFDHGRTTKGLSGLGRPVSKDRRGVTRVARRSGVEARNSSPPNQRSGSRSYVSCARDRRRNGRGRGYRFAIPRRFA